MKRPTLSLTLVLLLGQTLSQVGTVTQSASSTTATMQSAIYSIVRVDIPQISMKSSANQKTTTTTQTAGKNLRGQSGTTIQNFSPELYLNSILGAFSTTGISMTPMQEQVKQDVQDQVELKQAELM